MTVGKSKVTPYKQNCVRSIVESNIEYYKQITTKYKFLSHINYIILDLTAGDMNPEEETSPQIFLEKIKEHCPKNFKFHLFEKDKKTHQKLRSNINNWIDSIDNEHLYHKINKNTEVHYCDITSCKTKLSNKNDHGIAYFDPNGAGGEKELEFIHYFSKNNPKIDLLINMSVWMVKRIRGRKASKGNKYSGILLSDFLRTMNKRYWWIRMPRNDGDTWQWIMLYGTNSHDFDIPRYDFHLTSSLIGSFLVEEYDKYIMEIN